MSIRRLANVDDPASLSNRLRNQRFARFEALIAGFARPVRIIDIGGTSAFWERRGWAGRPDVHVTLVNLKADPSAHANITSLAGDATNLAGSADKSFDVAFSNSVIEHLFTQENQQAMAREVQRVARAFWVQTPNYWFPVEPHYHVLGWQWMPEGARVALLRRRRCGWRGPCPDIEQARRYVREVRLLTRRDLALLFPGATIVPERLLGLVKSWVVMGGFQ
jgi:hypothetical protein